MLEGKIFLPDTGMPILNSARSKVVLAVWLPEPFLVATRMEKSFTTGWGSALLASRARSKSVTLIQNLLLSRARRRSGRRCRSALGRAPVSAVHGDAARWCATAAGG